MAGNYTQTTGGELFFFWGSGEVLNVNGNATLSGYLSVSISPKHPAAKGSTITVMTFGSLSGEFTHVTVEEGGTVQYTNDSASW